MQITGPGADGVALTLTRTPPGARAWQVGEILHAIATSDNRAGQVTLRVGASVLHAATTLPVRAGQALTLEVLRLGDPPLLRIIEPHAGADVLGAALRQLLPRQSGLAPLLANLAHVGAQAHAGGALPAPALSAAAATMAESVFALFPTLRRLLTERGMRDALADSGLFLEAKLGQGTAPAALDTDLKAALLRLHRLLRDWEGTSKSPPSTAGVATPTRAGPPPLRGSAPVVQPPVTATLAALSGGDTANAELLRQVDGALARLQLHQLASVRDADGPPLWSVELPVRNGNAVDVFDMRIAPDAGSGKEADAQRRWVVTLAFELEGLGPVQARVSVEGERVSAAFHAERAETVVRFEQQMDSLRAALADAGLAVGDLSCRAGLPAAPPQGRAPRGPLLDERA